ncbi:PREDICTED: uncharacterized protein LOC109472665 [Branchiostoma belcheri]|uniref:Uncharacterized protein LOC109472665 n=1 Tax=Branchiostoma belcheri TaxID=7741 RepID=A0A6P4YUR4_BRABE|nr:PREDICTED: uncharacterized protein LOC109472665 [Branchiostoma belcheri]
MDKKYDEGTKDMATAMQNEEATDRQGTRLMETCMTSGAGVLYALLQAMLSASAAQFLVLSRQAGVPSLQLIFLIKLAQLLVALVALPLLRPKLTTENSRQTKLLTLSAITDNLVSVLKFLSFVFAVPGIAFGIMNGSTPFVTACIGFVFLEELLDMVDCFGIVLSSAGVIVVATGMIMENTSPVLHLAASILLPLATAFSKGPHTVMARSLIGVQGVSVLTVTLYSNLLGAVVLLGLTYLFETPLWAMSQQTMGYVIGLCLCVCGASFATKLALKTEKAWITVTIKMFTIPLAVALDYIVQSEFPSRVTFIGVSLVLFGTTLTAAYTWGRHRQKILHRNLMQSLNFDY